MKTQSKKKDVRSCNFILHVNQTKNKKRRISNSFDKNCTQENVTNHIQYEES